MGNPGEKCTSFQFESLMFAKVVNSTPTLKSIYFWDQQYVEHIKTKFMKLNFGLECRWYLPIVVSTIPWNRMESLCLKISYCVLERIPWSTGLCWQAYHFGQSCVRMDKLNTLCDIKSMRGSTDELKQAIILYVHCLLCNCALLLCDILCEFVLVSMSKNYGAQVCKFLVTNGAANPWEEQCGINIVANVNIRSGHPNYHTAW